ncbi:ion channel [Rhodovibrionaceae bacterium A322]
MADSAFHNAIRHLYVGRSRRATLFRYGLIVFDFVTIAFLVVTAPLGMNPAILTVDLVIGGLILLDFLARVWIAPMRWRLILSFSSLVDIVVILSLLLAPFFAQHLAFLRVLRALRLVHSYHVLRDLRKETSFFKENEEVVVASINLAVFIFITTAMVFLTQFGQNPAIDSYLDALYFTVATLTTTGFGDITLVGEMGKFLAIAMMIVGVALFLRLAQSIFRPAKQIHTCSSCGLTRHDRDAVHCKHCGETIKIETEGED